MAYSIEIYRPKEGADIVIRVRRDGINCSAEVGYDLHWIADGELSQPRSEFLYNHADFFATGLVFRVFRDDECESSVLEFATIKSEALSADDRKKALDSIPGLLRRVGVEADMTELEAALLSL